MCFPHPYGANGANGAQGAQGPQGPIGLTGASGVLDFGEFYALMPGDNAATVAPGAAVDFPNNGESAGGIVRIDARTFTLPTIGVYDVSWDVSVDEAGQLVVYLDGAAVPKSVAGRATGTSQIVKHVLIRTTVVNSALSIRNPAGNPTALTISPTAGGTTAVSATLVIQQIR